MDDDRDVSSDHHEIERTFAPDPRTTMPRLDGVGPIAEVGPPVVTDLEAAYLDTEDLALVRSGITLRRRTGGPDAGWHLKLPVGSGRDEVHEPLGEDGGAVPERLHQLVLGRTRRRPLEVVATISTRRTTTELLDRERRVLAEVSDDEVTGRLPDGPTVSWREWEVELVAGDEELLESVTERFAADGVVISEVQRKIETVLGDRLEPQAAPGHVLLAYLHGQVEALLREDVAIRRGRQTGVHQARVACRRMRSALAAFRPMLDTDVTEPVREELRWLGQSLSDVRDAVVARELLLAAIDAEEPSLVHGPVRERVTTTYGRVAEEGMAAAAGVLTSQRYLALLDSLAALLVDPPLTLDGEVSQKVLAKRLRAQVRRLGRRLADVRSAGSDPERELAWHETRKAAKRLRYAAEVARPELGKPVRRLVADVKAVTQVLGERQDTVVVRAHLLLLAADAADAGEPTFTYGLLHARQEARERELAYRAWETLDMLKSGTRSAGVAVRLK